MPVLPQASSRGQLSSPTTLALPTWSFSSPTNPFNPAEIATFRVLGLDSDFLADVINEDLREELFDMIARLAKLLSQIPSDERTGALLDLWLIRVKQQVIDERSMQIAQELASGTFARSDREAADALVQLRPDARFQVSKHQDEAVIAMLPPELAAEYRRAMALVDLKSLSSRFFSKNGLNAEHVALRNVLRRKFEEQGNMDREPKTYHPWALAAICDSIPSIDHWPNQITDAFVARDWKFGLSDGEVVLEIANGRDENLLAWFRENCSERFIRNRIMETRRKAHQTLRQTHEDEQLLKQEGVQAFWQANLRVSAGEGNV